MHSISQKMGVDPQAVLPENQAPAPYVEGGPAAAVGSFMQGFSKPLAAMAAVPVGLAGGVASRLGDDSLFRTYDQMTGHQGEADIARSPIAGGAGELAGSLAGFGITPGVGGASDLALVSKLASGGKVAQKLAPVVAHLVENAPGALEQDFVI